MAGVLDPEFTRAILERLAAANRQFAADYPGERADRHPVHTVYGGAHLFKADTAPRMGAAALETLKEHAPEPADFAHALGFAGGARLARTLYTRVIDKLRREPVEDFRIDFEDGYGNRPDAEEDGHAASAAAEVARGMKEDTLPPFIGIRIKPLSDELAERSLRTLDLFVTTLVSRTGGRLPSGFAVTLAKVTRPEQIAALVEALDQLERSHHLEPRSIALELMIETPQSVIDPRGGLAIPTLIAAAAGRCRGAHFGTYDYTAGLAITAMHQQPDHPACDFARHVLQASLAGTGVTISDGATNVMPVAPHAAAEGRELTDAEREENRRVVHRAWKIHFDDVRRSLRDAYYQSWDLHPGQLPSRYAAVFSFYLEARAAAAERLSRFVERAAQATLVGGAFDDAATGQGLLNFFLRGLGCGALTAAEAAATGLTMKELTMRSFVKILKARREKAR